MAAFLLVLDLRQILVVSKDLLRLVWLQLLLVLQIGNQIQLLVDLCRLVLEAVLQYWLCRFLYTFVYILFWRLQKFIEHFDHVLFNFLHFLGEHVISFVGVRAQLWDRHQCVMSLVICSQISNDFPVLLRSEIPVSLLGRPRRRQRVIRILAERRDVAARKLAALGTHLRHTMVIELLLIPLRYHFAIHFVQLLE